MTYCYARVSTRTQNLDRQIAKFEAFRPYKLYQDKESGKDFNRANYQKLKKKLQPNDYLIVSSLDRFGRNYDEIKKEWGDITNKGVIIKVLDMPLLNADSHDLISKFINDIVLQLLAFVAENERKNIKQRQREGIKIAKEKGVRFGRPKAIVPENTNEILADYINHKISNTKATKMLGISRNTFFKLVKEKKANDLAR